MTFKDLKKGDKIHYIKREIGLIDPFRRTKSPWYAVEFGTFVIEKASSVNYWVNGESHRKDMNGKDFREGFYLADDPLVINNQLPQEELDRIEYLFDKIIRVERRILEKLLTIPDVGIAGQLAIDIIEAEKRVNDVCLALELKKIANIN